MTSERKPKIKRRQNWWYAVYQDGRLRDRTPEENRWNKLANDYCYRMNRK